MGGKRQGEEEGKEGGGRRSALGWRREGAGKIWEEGGKEGGWGGGGGGGRAGGGGCWGWGGGGGRGRGGGGGGGGGGCGWDLYTDILLTLHRPILMRVSSFSKVFSHIPQCGTASLG